MRTIATVVAMMLGSLLAGPAYSAEKFGTFENIFESSATYQETTEAIEAAISQSDLSFHSSHDIRVPDGVQQAKIYVLTSPMFAEAAASESPLTVSAQVLRLAVFTKGDAKQTFVNMANPVSIAMVFYAGSENYTALLEAAAQAANEVRRLVSAIPGKTVSIQAEPLRTEKHYNKYKGDGPARMMAKFRTWHKSQRPIDNETTDDFEATVERVAAMIKSSSVVADASESVGWEEIARIRLRDDAVYFGLSNPFIEDRMVRINSRFRSDGKSESAPYPGVDHVAALPTDVLVVKVGDETKVLQYGQMWRMQYYFWDSGYRAFTANVGVPGDIQKSIETALESPDN